MTRDRRSKGSALVFGIGFAVFASVPFFLANAGLNPLRNTLLWEIDPDRAPSIGAAALFLLSALAAFAFYEDKPPAGSSRARAQLAEDPHGVKRRQPPTAFVRSPWHRVFAVGPVWAVCGVIAAFIWHAFAKDSGIPGTVWGDFTASPLPAIAVLFGLWATVNFSLALGAIADAFHRTLWAIFLVVSVLIVILAITIGVVASNVFTMSPVAALAVTAVCLLITTAALIPARLFAGARARVTNRIDAAHETRLQSLLTALAPGENLMLHFADRENPAGQMLAATNQRLLLAAPTSTGTGPTRPGQVRILDQAHPGQLHGASTKFRPAGHTTSVHFRDRPDMEFIGGDPSEADKFAEALTSLATTGRLPQEEDT
ncbi:hypothetical protein KTJ89_15275 [Brevibacterium sediminis]|uniref:hypothetical protein n=1 Tax=Brevibacterium sediminis TaxID=1857024 RepID=UPI002175221A|nr:hypothetical protein [Brevibacterium sediminis]MCS4594349.1 hypothetical protein [Brevibacterium sediminis]